MKDLIYEQSTLNFDWNKIKTSLYIYFKRIINLNVEIMITKNDVAKVFDTVLSIPGMNETVKIDLKISRKNVLLLSHLIEIGIDSKKEDSMLMDSISPDCQQDLKSISEECLLKAGLVELNEKLAVLSDTAKT